MEMYMSLETFTATLTGVSPLLLHNGQLSDPMSKASKALKEVTSRKKKTDTDLEEIRRLEWIGSLYLNDAGKPSVPVDNVLSLIINGARKDKNGKEAQAGVMQDVGHEFFEVIYEGPKDLETLYADPKFVDCRSARVGQSRVMRTRPVFRNWKIKIKLLFNPDVIDKRDIQQALEMSGERIGLGDYRPRFGRFTVE
jgi:hypothetical protein